MLISLVVVLALATGAVFVGQEFLGWNIFGTIFGSGEPTTTTEEEEPVDVKQIFSEGEQLFREMKFNEALQKFETVKEENDEYENIDKKIKIAKQEIKNQKSINEAKKKLAELEADYTPWDTWYIALIYVALGEKDQAFRWLEAAYGPPNHPYLPWMSCAPAFKPLRDDPRFSNLLLRMNLLQ